MKSRRVQIIEGPRPDYSNIVDLAYRRREKFDRVMDVVEEVAGWIVFGAFILGVLYVLGGVRG